jgi:hypothetical protein
MELGNGFSCSAGHIAQVCPGQNLTINVISGATQSCSGSRKTMWILQFYTRVVRLRMQLDNVGYLQK